MRSRHSFLLALAFLVLAMIWKTFFQNAPFDGFATALTAIFSVYIGKRLVQKHEKFGGNGGSNGPKESAD